MLVLEKANTLYQPGDMVTVRADLSAGKRYAMDADQNNNNSVTVDMLEFRGKDVFISYIHHLSRGNQYGIEGDPLDRHWTDEMFEERIKYDPLLDSEDAGLLYDW